MDQGIGTAWATRNGGNPVSQMLGSPMVRMSLVSCLQVSGDNGEAWGGYGGRVRSVALVTTRWRAT